MELKPFANMQHTYIQTYMYIYIYIIHIEKHKRETLCNFRVGGNRDARRDGHKTTIVSQ
jgi:hypothetical protein